MLCPSVSIFMIVRFDYATYFLSYLFRFSLTHRTRQREKSLQIPSHTLLLAPSLHAIMQIEIIRPPPAIAMFRSILLLKNRRDGIRGQKCFSRVLIGLSERSDY